MIEATPSTSSSPYLNGLTEEVARLALDPSVPDMSVAMAYVVVPEVAKRLTMSPEDPTAFLALDQIAAMVGCSRRNVERYAAHTSLVLVEKGTPWWMRDSTGEHAGGFASQWDLSASVLPADLDVRAHGSDPVQVWRWLDPRGEQWVSAGLRAWRLVLALVVACETASVTVSAAAAADVLGCSRSTGARALRGVRDIPGARVTEAGVAMDLGLMMAAGASVHDKDVETCPNRRERLRVARQRWHKTVANLLAGLTPSNVAFIEASIVMWEKALGRPYEMLLDDIIGPLRT